MKEIDIIKCLMLPRYARSFCLPRYTPHKWWECDMFEVTEAGYFREYEIKLTKGDFKADAKKSKNVFPWGPQQVEKKHALLEQRSVRGPVEFYYVVPEGLLTEKEVPEWAGLIEIMDSGERRARRYYESPKKSAPRLHRSKIDDKTFEHAKSVCYWRMHSMFWKDKDLDINSISAAGSNNHDQDGNGFLLVNLSDPNPDPVDSSAPVEQRQPNSNL